MPRRGAWLALLAVVAAPLALAQSRGSSPGSYSYGSNYPNSVPQGTRFVILLDDKLDTSKLSQGKRFKAHLGNDLVAPDGSTIARGSKVRGHVSSVERGLHARLLLSFDQVQTRNGWVPLAGTVTGVPGEHGVKPETGQEGEIERRGVDTRRAVESTAVGAGVGAVAGTVAGGGKGAAVGAAVGGAAGLGAGVLTNRDLKLDKGAQLEVRLDRDLLIPGR